MSKTLSEKQISKKLEEFLSELYEMECMVYIAPRTATSDAFKIIIDREDGITTRHTFSGLEQLQDSQGVIDRIGLEHQKKINAIRDEKPEVWKGIDKLRYAFPGYNVSMGYWWGGCSFYIEISKVEKGKVVKTFTTSVNTLCFSALGCDYIDKMIKDLKSQVKDEENKDAKK